MSNVNHKKKLRSAGGYSSITHEACMIEMKNGQKFIYHPKDVNLSYLLMNGTMFSFVNDFKNLYRVHMYGSKCIDNHEFHTFCIVQNKHNGEMYGFPMFTDTALGMSRYIRKHNEDFRSTCHYATLLREPTFPPQRWIRIVRTGNGMTGVMELPGDREDSGSWHPVSYLFDREAELLKMELHTMQEDFIFENEAHEHPYTEWSVSSEAYQMILNRCIFLKSSAY